MTKLEEFRALAAQAAATGPDMTEATKGGGARLLPEGYAFAQLVEYVEFGMQPQEFGGVAKQPNMEVQIGFALFNTGDKKYANDDGTPYIVRPYSFALSRNDKAKAFKTFNKMNYTGQKKHYAELLGDKYLVKIIHKDKSATDKTKVSVIDLEGTLPPFDAASGQPYQIPDAPDNMYRLFLWDYPTKDAWDSLFIEGTFDDGKSKNKIQETCIGALDFEGSALQTLLMGANIAALPTAPVVPQANPTHVPTAGQPALPTATSGISGGTVASPALPQPGTTATTSPSKPVMPVMPAMPVMPTLPVPPK